MTYAILALLLLSLIHYVYSGIVLPSIRFQLRNRLFALRDDLRNLKISQGSRCNDVAFRLLHDGINNNLPRLQLLTLRFKVDFDERYKNDSAFRARIDGRRKVIDDCDDAEFKRIRDEVNQVVELAFIANMGGWFLYIIPIVLLLIPMFKISELAKQLIATNAADVEGFAELSLDAA